MKLPDFFQSQMQLLLGNEYEAFIHSLLIDSPVSIRFNKQPKFLSDNPYAIYPKIAWSDDACYLPSRPVFTLDPLLHAGVYYVQEAASMFLSQVIKHIQKYDNEPKIVLDLCAAPGGKSTHLLNLLSNDSLLIANEIIRSRANILNENITKWGASNCLVTNNDPRDFSVLKNFFDIILVDAPCSGEGMFRKDKDAINEWSESNIRLCLERQRRILADVWNSLKPNGYLIYSTCTYNVLENEENVLWLMNKFGAESIKIDVSEDWNITQSCDKHVFAARFFPHKTKSEGLFITLLRKSSINSNSNYDTFKKNKPQLQKLNKQYGYITDWLIGNDRFFFNQNNNYISALPIKYISEIDFLKKHLKLISSGIYLGGIKGKDFIPSEALALNNSINKYEFNSCELDLELALNYLRRLSITLPILQHRGYVLVTYKGISLGWVKNLGNRSNNLYPIEWRIRNL